MTTKTTTNNNNDKANNKDNNNNNDNDSSNNNNNNNNDNDNNNKENNNNNKDNNNNRLLPTVYALPINPPWVGGISYPDFRFTHTHLQKFLLVSRLLINSSQCEVGLRRVGSYGKMEADEEIKCYGKEG